MIRSAKQDDLKNIAVLHIECFPDYFLTRLGLSLLAKYYKEFITIDNIFLISVEDSKVNGLLVGTPSSAVGRNGFIRKNLIALLLRMLWLCIKFDKETWKRVFGLINSFRILQNANNKAKNNQINTEPSLLSICVSENYKGKGIAKKLMREFERQLVITGYHGYNLTVHKSNQRAIKFYEKLGLVVYRETKSEYGYKKIFN